MLKHTTTIRPENVKSQRQRAPSLPTRSMFTNMSNLQRDPLGFLLNTTSEYGDVVRIPFLVDSAYLINHPDGVKHVLQENNRNFNKDVFDYKILAKLLGKGLLTNDGASWLQQRRLMQPAFHRQHLATFGTLMTDATTDMLERWDDIADHSQVLDVSQEMMRLTLRIVGQALFSLDLSKEADTVGQTFSTVNALVNESFYSPLLTLYVPTPHNRRLKTESYILDRVVDEIIKKRRQQNIDTDDLLSMLLEARDEETGKGMDDR